MTGIINWIINYQYIVIPFASSFITLMVLIEISVNLWTSTADPMEISLNGDEEKYSELNTVTIQVLSRIFETVDFVVFIWCAASFWIGVFLYARGNIHNIWANPSRLEFYPTLCIGWAIGLIALAIFANICIKDNLKEMAEIINKGRLFWCHREYKNLFKFDFENHTDKTMSVEDYGFVTNEKNPKKFSIKNNSANSEISFKPNNRQQFIVNADGIPDGFGYKPVTLTNDEGYMINAIKDVPVYFYLTTDVHEYYTKVDNFERH